MSDSHINFMGFMLWGLFAVVLIRGTLTYIAHNWDKEDKNLNKRNKSHDRL